MLSSEETVMIHTCTDLKHENIETKKILFLDFLNLTNFRQNKNNKKKWTKQNLFVFDSMQFN